MTNREDWIGLGICILDDGRVPAEIGVARAGREIGVGKGSFVHHFGEVTEWHRAIISRWRQEDKSARAEQALDVVRDPLDRLRQLRRAAERHAARRSAMRRWAESTEDDKPKSCAQEAAHALAESDAAIFEDVTAALSLLNLAEEETAALALVLAPELGCGRPRVQPGDTAKFEALLAVVARAASAGQPSAAEVSEIPGDDGDMVLCLVAARPGTSIDHDQLRVWMQQLAQRISPAADHGGSTGTARPSRTAPEKRRPSGP